MVSVAIMISRSAHIHETERQQTYQYGLAMCSKTRTLTHAGDVLTHLGPYTLANDGTITLRPGQRVTYGHAAALKHVGDTLQATVIRNGQKLNLSMRYGVCVCVCVCGM